MDCRERILSEDYYDIITDFPLREELLEDDLCYIAVENLYNLIYFNKERAEPENEYFYTHRILPKLYGLMQEGNLGLPDSQRHYTDTAGAIESDRKRLRACGDRYGN